MSIQTVARRYANALADVVTKSGETQKVQTELNQFVQMMTENPLLEEVFRNPSVPFEQKKNLLETLITRTKPTQTTANFLRVLLQNQRLSELSIVNQRFANVLEERAGVVSAEVITAQPLTDAQKSALEKQLQSVTGKKVYLNFKIDEDLIGGVVTRIGSTVYDGSVKNQLQQLKEKMIKS
jgi:F-type H+-transporting ATPase subunit delta